MVSSLIPPKIASPSAVSGGGAGKDLTFIVGLYDRIAKGPKSEQARWGKGFYRHFNGSTASGKPLVAIIGGLLVTGYTIHYTRHLHHHKLAEH